MIRTGLHRRLAAFVLALPLAGFADAGERLALVIGNGAYESIRPLKNPESDARAIAARLRELGFELVGVDGGIVDSAVIDLDENGFLDAIDGFAERVGDTDDVEMAFVYYAGHGMQHDGNAFLLPVDVPGGDPERTLRDSVKLDGILAELDGKAALTIAVFDACREIPSLENATRSAGGSTSSFRGLARPTAARQEGKIIAYSGAPGQLVEDGDGEHSPYTAALLSALDVPDLQVIDTFRTAEFEFLQQGRGQAPEVFSRGVKPETFYLSRSSSASRSSTSSPDEAIWMNLDQTLWLSTERTDTVAAYESYVERFPDGFFVDLAHEHLRLLRGTETSASEPIEETTVMGTDEPSTTTLAHDMRSFELLGVAMSDLATVRRDVCSRDEAVDADAIKREAASIFHGQFEYSGQQDQARGWALYLESIAHCSTSALVDIAKMLEKKRRCTIALEYAQLAAEHGHLGARRLIGQIKRKRTCES